MSSIQQKNYYTCENVTYNHEKNESIHILEITEMMESSDKETLNFYNIIFKTQRFKGNIMIFIEEPNIIYGDEKYTFEIKFY